MSGDPTSPSSRDWARLWRAARPAHPPHPVGIERLGEYAALLRDRGGTDAARTFPAVAAHLAAGCAACRADLVELLTALNEQ